MKLSMLFVLLGMMQARADVHAQGSVTLTMQQAEIAKVLTRIEKAGEFRFLYNYDLASLRKKVDVHFQHADIRTALADLFRNTDLKYKILDNNLVVVVQAGSQKQAIRITGTVTGANNETLAGVSVQVKGGTGGTSTGAQGEYAITIDTSATLIFSYIGYQEKEEAINGRTVVDVRLAPAEKALDQVVVVGYGSQKRKDVTGAVSTVTAADIANRPVVGAAEALQGKAAGVQVTSNSGKPGAGLTIRVRGSSSISAGNDPLYIVDGIPTTDVSSINPSDIESFSVLKDAASASIYGTRAANGVVLITTKKGVNGKNKVEFSTYYGITSPTKMLPVLNSKQYQAYANQQKDPTIVVTDAMVVANDVNWPKEVFKRGNQQNYQLAFSGGTEKTQHYISFNYTDQVGIIKPAKYDRYTGRVNLTTKATNWLTVTTSTFITHSHNRDVTDNASVARGGVVLSSLETPSIIPKFNSLANNTLFGLNTTAAPVGSIAYNPLTGWENPYGTILGNYSKNLNDRILTNLGFDVKLVKGLTFQSRFGLDYQDNKYQYFLDPFLIVYGRQTHGQQNQTKLTNQTWLSEQTLNYTNTWGKNHLTALAGWTAQDSHTEQTYISGSFLNQQYRLLPWDQSYLLDSIKAPGTTSIDDWGLISVLGRVTYDFDGKYLMQANLRSDQSSKFAKGNRTATFPSFSAGWRISREDFMQHIDLINDLKIRAGWGKNGNQEGIGSYSYLPLSNIDPVSGAISTSTITSKSLTWETSTQTNIGVDATVLNNRITFSGDFYVKKTKNILVNIPLPVQGGYATAPVNGADIKNTGEEFLISTKNIIHGDVKWTTDLNISFNQNKVTRLPVNLNFISGYGNIYARGSAILLQTGYGLGEFYGYVAKGVDPATGHELYLANDNKTLTDDPSPSARRFLGSAQPTFGYGITNNVSWKNFELTVFIQGSQGNKIFNAGRLELEAMTNSANQSTAVLRRWQKAGDITDIPGVSTDATTNNSLISTRFLESGSYLRFKTITVSYKLPVDLLSKIGLGAATIYVSGNNLLTITKYKGFDPEVNSYGSTNNSNENRNISLGVDNGAYPQSKMFLFGLNVSLK